ncbi:MAG TPA: VCBS repeat-containing protein [Myxococcaceae bacterium]|nr:VCBS repeat-containing protein [Myxococcaceae bacterium]
MSGAGLAALLVLAQATSPGALGALAEAVAAQVHTAGAEPPLALAVSAPGRPALERAFATELLGRLTAAGLAPRLLAVPDPERAAREQGARSLLRLRLDLAGTLVASGDVLSTWVNFWAGRAQTRSASPGAAVAAEVSADATVRLLARAGEGLSLELDPEPLARWPVRTLAVATGSLDPDGQPLVAVLTEEAVEVRGRDGRLLARRSLDALPRADPPSRDPFGTLCICQRRLLAFSAGRAAGEVLELSGGALVPREALARPVLGCLSARLEASLFPGLARFVPSSGPWPSLPGEPRAWGGSVRAGAPGPGVLVLLEDGTARWAEGTGGLHALPGVGAGAAAVDLAGDGAVRIAASSSAAAPAVDRLRLLAPDGGAELASVEVPGRILQVAAWSSARGSEEELLLGVWRTDGGSELRLARRGR